SLTVYLVETGTTNPVQSILPSYLIHPTSIIFYSLFKTSSKAQANECVKKVLSVSITSDQIQKVISKTLADGGGTNAHYITRLQKAKFVNSYFKYVKTFIYTETTESVTDILSSLQKQFDVYFEQAINSSQQIKSDSSLYQQMRNSADLNPDLLTNELTKIFTYNDTATKFYQYKDDYFNYDQASSSSSSGSGGAEGSLFGIFSLGFGGEWTGQKWFPKSFNVSRIADITEKLQIALVATRLTADRDNDAIIRTVNGMNYIVITTSTSTSTKSSTAKSSTTKPSTTKQPTRRGN
ncbi:unnamed protein product, partial [Didymodactylos carnosus]